MKALLSALLLLAVMPLQAANEQLEGTIEKGRLIFHATGCVLCHTDWENNGEPLAGGYALETDFGIFYSPNITPDLSLIHISEPTRR